MLSLYTTERILSQIYLSADDTETSIWYSFITKDNLFSSLNVWFDENTDFETNEYNPTYQLAHSNAIPCNKLNDRQGNDDSLCLSDVIRNLEIGRDPYAIFLLDISSNEAKDISTKYGVICHSFQESPKTNPLFIESRDISVVKDEPRKGWHEILSPDFVNPSNSLIIIDRYLFAKRGKTGGEKEGLKNLYNIIDNILPHTLSEKISYHILVVFDSLKNNSRTDFKNISEKINDFKNKLGRKYQIIIETISISDPNSVRSVLSESELYYKTHNRRIISNYFIIRAEHSLTAFDESKGLCTQVISFDWAVSKGILRSKNSDIPAKSIFNTLNDIKDAIKKCQNCIGLINVRFCQNGREVPLKEIKNRMIGLSTKN